MSGRRRKLLAAVVAAKMIIKRKEDRNKKRSCWVEEWIAKRNQFGVFSQLIEELKCQDPVYYENFLRMAASDFEILLKKVTLFIEKQDTVMRLAISAGERLALTLRYLAAGDSYHTLMYMFRISVSAIAEIIPECCHAIYEVLKGEYLKMPNSEAEWLEISRQFEEKWNFPLCLGALDGKHVVVQAPPNSGSHFNYKGCHSIVLMALVDADYKFLYNDVGCNGRVSDGEVFNNCSLARALEENRLSVPSARTLQGREKPVPFVIVDDDAFAIKPYIMKPYPFRNQPAQHRVFNYRLSRARRVVENAFGHIANRFRILRKPIELCPKKAVKVVSAICVLHNFLIENNKSIYACQGSFDTDYEGNINEGSWRQEGMPSRNLIELQKSQPLDCNQNCKEIRTEFTEYFFSSQGEVSWQYGKI